MRKINSRNRILLGAVSAFLYMIGDYFLGLDTIYTGSDAVNSFGIVANTAPDWRYALSSLLGFIAAGLLAVAVPELLRVLERKYGLGGSKLYTLFKIGNIFILVYGAFIHLAISMLPVVFNAGMELTGDGALALGMAVRVARSVAVPMGISFVVMDVLASAGWIGMTVKGLIPVKKWMLIFNPLCIALIGQIIEMLPFPVNGVDSGFESLGWLTMYLVSALYLADKELAK